MSELRTVTQFPHFINGENREPGSGRYIPVYNPATNELIAEAAEGTPEDLDTAVRAAREAFDCEAWRHMPAAERSRLLYAIANTVMAHAQELAELEVAASGGTVSRVMGMDIPALADMFMVLAEEVKSFPFVENLPARPLPEPTHTQVWREPVGVCGLITAWNVPLLLFALKVAPALATGNTVVLKPSELTPTSTLRLVELLSPLLPKGVLNVVNGYGEVIGDAMCRHPDVDKISFTGSTRVGKLVQSVASQSLKRVSVELGGKGPGIVLPDADLELVAYGALYGVYLNGGQACESGTRLLVHESIHDELVAKLAELSARMVLGDPADPATGMGPMSSAAHGEKVLEYVSSAVEEGATVLCGGGRAAVPGCEDGFFVEPTVLTQVHNGMKVAREEIFGPVLCVIKFSTEEEAIAIANDTDYGLSAGIKYALHHNLTDVRDAIQAGIKLETWPLAGPMAIPHIAVPTTAGTGAEVTPVAVLYNETLGIKGNIVAPFIEADMAVLDANLSRALPPKITAATGMDALTHAIEAITSPNANHFTDAQAKLAAQLIVDNLPTAVHSGQDVDARSTMLQASTMACSAFSNALNAAPVHNCAHAFGALYHIPHGDANAALLPIVMEALPEFYLPQAQRLAIALGLDARGNSGELLLMDVIERIIALQRQIGCAGDFAAYDISPEDGHKIASAIAADPAALFYPIPVEAIGSIVARAIGEGAPRGWCRLTSPE